MQVFGVETGVFADTKDALFISKPNLKFDERIFYANTDRHHYFFDDSFFACVGTRLFQQYVL